MLLKASSCPTRIPQKDSVREILHPVKVLMRMNPLLRVYIRSLGWRSSWQAGAPRVWSGPHPCQSLQRAACALSVAQRPLAHRTEPAGRRFVAVAEQSVVSRRRKLCSADMVDHTVEVHSENTRSMLNDYQYVVV